MVDNMSTKDLVEYVTDDLFQYFDKQFEQDFLDEARNYWEDSFDDVVEHCLAGELLVQSKKWEMTDELMNDVCELYINTFVLNVTEYSTYDVSFF